MFKLPAVLATLFGVKSVAVVRGVIFVGTAACSFASGLLPTDEGMTWEYDALQEASNAPPSRSVTTVRVVGKQMLDGKELLKLETSSAGNPNRTHLIQADDDGVIYLAEITADQKVEKFASPRVLLRTPLTVGATWESQEEFEGNRIPVHSTLKESESLTLPMGACRADRVHSEDAPSGLVVIDRWFVPGIGFVKDVTVIRSASSDLVRRYTLELKREPGVTAEPSVASTPPESPAVNNAVAKPLHVDASDKASAPAKTVFAATTENIFIRWDGHDLRKGAELRATWVAEDVGGIVAPNFVIDELSALIARPDSQGRFTLSRPKDGWAEGRYRVEIYLDNSLVETLKLTIGK